MTKEHELLFEDSLEDSDYGFIVCGKTGKLKGLWIPSGSDDDEVPETIVRMCIDIFDIDPAEFEDTEEETSYGKTLH